MRRTSLLRALALCAALARPALAVRPLTPPAPEFPKGLTWINSEELSLERLRGRRVVVVSMLSVSSMNSLRAMAKLESWWRRYSQNGLMVIGVHTPDFDFEKDPAAVRAELKRRGVTFPVVLDNGRALWKAYRAEGWPTHFLVDPKGRVLFDRLGEGRAQEFEIELLGALEAFGRYSPKGYWPAPDPPQKDCANATPPRLLGAARGRPALPLGEERGRMLVSSREGETVYRGRWTLEPEALRSQRASREDSDLVRLIYRGASALALAKAPSPAKFYVKQDDFWLDEKNSGPDVQRDKSHRSFVTVSGPRFYDLVRNPNDNVHELVLYPARPGMEVYAFDFTNACQTPPGR